MVPNLVHESFPGAAFEAAALLSYCLSPGRTTMNVSRIVAFSIWTLPTPPLLRPSLCGVISQQDRDGNGAVVHQREATKTLDYSFASFYLIFPLNFDARKKRGGELAMS